MLIDTHAHLDYTDFAPDRAEVLARAHAAGVTEIISIGTRLDSSAAAVKLAQTYPQIWATVGVHPCDVESVQDVATTISALRTLAQNEPRVVAMGEIGLDYHRLPATEVEKHKQHQVELFHAQLELAAELKLNVVIHQRDSWEDTLAVLLPFTGKVRGVFHCFGGTLAQAQELLELGHLVSFTGIVSFKNAVQVQETVRGLATGTFMVETDCPYLAPTPHRGKRCEPAYTARVAEVIAQLRGESVKKIAEITTATARTFFKFAL